MTTHSPTTRLALNDIELAILLENLPTSPGLEDPDVFRYLHIKLRRAAKRLNESTPRSPVAGSARSRAPSGLTAALKVE